MTTTQNEEKIIPYRKRRHLNIGIVIFGIILIYLIATIVLYLTAPHVNVYEVRQGSILKDNAYTGLALRKESIVYAEDNGYVNYYIENNSKVRVGTKVYTISDDEMIFDESSDDTTTILTEEQLQTLGLKIQSYNDQFQENHFYTSYQLKEDLQSSLDKYTNQSKTEQLQQLLAAENNSGIKLQSASKDGMIVYSVDGMEDLTAETISEKQLHKNSYKKTDFFNNMQVSSGDPVYKIVTDDRWELFIQISKETADALTGKTSVKVHFKKDDQSIYAKLSFLENTKEPVVRLQFDHSMIRYINERYLDVELILEDETGLKIPKSAETTKEFYLIPKEYLTLGGNSNSEGVLLQTKDADGNIATRFFAVTVYYEKDEKLFLDPNVFEKGAILLKPDSTETLTLGEKDSLKGVYCINKGYAVFKQIQILCESDEYYIIEEGNAFGLSNYDHIALDSSTIHENDIVF